MGSVSSSDDVRSGAPLRHAQRVTLAEPLGLEMGGSLPSVTVAYETYGTLSPQRDNAVLVCHAISGDSHVARHSADDESGWWDIAVGPGRAIDTDRYFVICANVLGGCRGTTGPNSTDPQTGRPYGAGFPDITVADMVEVQRRLIDHLGIERLLAVVGGSLGGHQALTWAVRFPDRVEGCAVLAASARLTSQALAFDIVGRNAILRDPNFHGGQYYGRASGPSVGLALARMLGHITYLSRQAMTTKFDADRFAPRDVPTEFEKHYSVGSYLAYQGHRFVERFDANSYVTLSRAMDRFDLGDTREKLAKRLGGCSCRWLVVSFSSDWLFPPEQSQEIVEALVRAGRQVNYCNVTSTCGHDAFLLEEDLSIYGGLLSAFLANRDGRGLGASLPGCTSATPTSIFHGYRLDYDLILGLIPAGASVLDLGCGGGELLALLRERSRPSRLVGVELDEASLLTAVERGINVIHHDLERPLAPFADHQFDVVVLSQTLQSVADTERVINEMLRVGRRGIVSLPNFAYRKLREMLYREGRSPKAAGSYSYEWYNTPNRRFPSILDFREFCRAKSIVVEREVYLDSESDARIDPAADPNLNADVAIFMISRQPDGRAG